MSKKLNESAIMKALDWGYEQALNGLPGMETAEDFAQSYMRGGGETLTDKVDSLIRWQNAKAVTSGFVNGLGGIVLMPLTVPASLTISWYIQIRMIAAIAYMGGCNLRDDKVRTLVYVCLCGNGAKDILKDIGIVVGTKITHKAIESISSKMIVKINQTVGFRLLTKFGEKGVINLGKGIPIIGGIIGGVTDGLSTNIVGNIAKDSFI